ncbi:AAA family ATPase [Rhodococcus aetherivorans]
MHEATELAFSDASNGYSNHPLGNALTSGNTALPITQPPMRVMSNEDEDLYADVAALLDGTAPAPPAPSILRRLDGHALFYEGCVNWVFGDPESGKTWVCLAAAVESLNNGGRVLVVDLDHNGAASTVSRLIGLGAEASALRDRDRFRYSESDDSMMLLAVVADAIEWKPTVVVVDSIGELLPMFGANSNSADEFTSVNRRVLRPLASSGAAVLAVDHLAKGNESRSYGAGGSAAKKRAIDGTSLRVKVKEAFAPGKGGESYLSVNKDRHGGVRANCPVDSEPPAGVFKLLAFEDGILEWQVKAPKIGDRAVDEVSDSDLEAVRALDPQPKSVADARERLGWGMGRASAAMKKFRES